MSAHQELLKKRISRIKNEEKEQLICDLKEILVDIRRPDGTRQRVISSGLVETLVSQLKTPGDDSDCRCLKLKVLGTLAMDFDARHILLSGGNKTCADLLAVVEQCKDKEAHLLAVLDLIALLSSFQDERSVELCENLKGHLRNESYVVRAAAAKALTGCTRYLRFFSVQVVGDLVQLLDESFKRTEAINSDQTAIVTCLLNMSAEMEMKDRILQSGKKSCNVLKCLVKLTNTWLLQHHLQLCQISTSLCASLFVSEWGKKMDTESIEAQLVKLLLFCQVKSIIKKEAIILNTKAALTLLAENPKKLLKIGLQIMSTTPELVVEVFGEEKAAKVADQMIDFKLIEKRQCNQAVYLLRLMCATLKGCRAIWGLPNIVPRLAQRMTCKDCSDSEDTLTVLTSICLSYAPAGVHLRDLAAESKVLRRVLHHTALRKIISQPKLEVWEDDTVY